MPFPGNYRKDLQSTIANECFPPLVVHYLELRQILRDEQELGAKAGGLRDRMLDDFHAPQTGEFIEHEQGWIARSRTSLDPLHLADRQADHQPEPAEMRFHKPLWEGEVK